MEPMKRTRAHRVARRRLPALTAIVLLGCSTWPKTTVWDSGAQPCATSFSTARWERAAPEALGFDPEALEALAQRIESGDLEGIHSLLVVRDGELAFERYFAGDDRDWGRPLGHVEFDANTLHDLRSVTKSVVSALIGIAHGDGLLSDLDQPLSELLPDSRALCQRARTGPAITLRHALTMPSRS